MSLSFTWWRNVPNLERMIQDLIEGAERGGADVERQCDRGHEEKLAYEQSTLLGGIPFMGPGLAGLSAAAHEGHMGPGVLASSGAALGQAGGTTLGAGLGGLTGAGIGELISRMNAPKPAWWRPDHDTTDDRNLGAMIGTGLGGIAGLVGGGMAGSSAGRSIGHHPTQELAQAKEAGFYSALEQYKVAFIAPLLGMAARLGGGALAQRGLQAGAGMAAKRGMGGVSSALARGGKFLGGTGVGNQIASAAVGEGIGQGVDRITGNG